MRVIETIAMGLGLSCVAAFACAQTSPGLAQAAEEKAVNLCSTCHGPRGISTSPEFPILAAQQKEYIIAQLHALRDKSRAEKDAHDFMWGIAGQLDDPMIDAIATYYSMQPAAPGRDVGDPALIAKGKKLFEEGVPDRSIPACETCHGKDATGAGTIPRLAGQHAKYVAKQLAYIQSLVRAAPVMHGIVKEMTPMEMQAVAAYVQSK